MSLPPSYSAEPPPDGHGAATARLTVGELARRTGLTPAVLRTWEARHGFPRPARLDSGHRRYDEQDVETIAQVLRRRDAGVRLDVALTEAAAGTDAPVPPPSVFAALRRSRPALTPRTLRKATLLALTWALEDESCARAQHPLLFGAFQHDHYYDRARRRWQDLARTARHTVVFAAFDTDPTPVPGVTTVALPESSPMRREWSLVCDAPDHCAVLAAWELPGQSAVPDADRLFEAVWSLDPRDAREAARTCMQMATRWGASSDLGDLVDALDGAPMPEVPPAELGEASAVFTRLLSYVDRGSPV